MECTSTNLILFLVFIFTFQSYLMNLSCSKSIITKLPGYSGNLPFELETGYVGVGKKEEIQLFYYFVRSTRNPERDPLIFYLPGGPGASALPTFLFALGPPSLDTNYGPYNYTFTLQRKAWLEMANVLYLDIPAGSGYSYSETADGWLSSDNIVANYATEFIKKFLSDHPNFLRNRLYVTGISYMGLIVPKITLDIYEGNERGDQPKLNIQGYILVSPLTDKFSDFNSRFEYAHRMALISDDTYKSALKSCDGNYLDIVDTNSLCANAIRQYQECTSHINMENILDSFCDVTDPEQRCLDEYHDAVDVWANTQLAQQVLNVRQGTVGNFVSINSTLHYSEGKSDIVGYSYDIFSSFSYHEKLKNRRCQALIMSGDHDMTFPYVGVEQWISSLNMSVEIPWKPFFVDGEVAGYETKYAQNFYSMTYATVKGAGHVVPLTNPNETYALMDKWFDSQIYLSDS